MPTANMLLSEKTFMRIVKLRNSEAVFHAIIRKEK